MTNLQEAKLAREAEICYATLAMVTDYDCWHPEHAAVTAASVMQVLAQNVATARAVLRAVTRRLPVPRECECEHALRHALLTPAELVPEAVKRELAPIVGRYLR
jgi:5'-methylthioadenosine phosphorylase